jgi:hypothetical protein
MHHNYTDEQKQNIINWVTTSINLLISNDSDLLYPAKIETEFKIDGQKELNREVHETTLNHRLAHYIEILMSDFKYNDYKVDTEYNRFINQRKMVHSIQTGQLIEVRPDIIVHKRTRLHEHDPHLLVVEAKKYSNNDKDRNHVRDIMQDHNYQYIFGLLISYYENIKTINCELLTLENKVFKTQKLKIEK